MLLTGIHEGSHLLPIVLSSKQPLCSKLQTMNYEATTLGTARTASILQ